MIINKAEGQSLKEVSIDLREEYFSHGQLHAAYSRVGSAKSLHMYNGTHRKRKTNRSIVYKEVLC
jgi:hypothetical protein